MAVIIGKFREMDSLTSDLLLGVSLLEGQLRRVLAAKDRWSNAPQQTAVPRANDVSVTAPTYASRLKSTHSTYGASVAPSSSIGG